MVAAPAELDALTAVVAGMRQVAVAGLADEREDVRWRTAFIEATEELRERELLKLAAIGGAVAGALRTRGLSDADAGLVADAGLAVFRAALARWTGAEGDDRELAELIDDTLDRFRALVAGR